MALAYHPSKVHTIYFAHIEMDTLRSYVCSALYAMACNLPPEKAQPTDGSDKCFSLHIVRWEIRASHFIVTVKRHLSEKSMHTHTRTHQITRIIFYWKNQNGIFIYFSTKNGFHLNANGIRNSRRRVRCGKVNYLSGANSICAHNHHGKNPFSRYSDRVIDYVIESCRSISH